MDINNLLNVSPTSTHTHTVVFLHGRGDTARGLAHSLHYSRARDGRTLYHIFPSFRWVFPEARLNPCVAFPGQSWKQWFDIWNVQDFSDHEEHQATGLRENVPLIRRLIAQEAAVLGGRYDRIILAGISQGGATSVHTLLNLHIPPPGDERASRGLAAFLGFCCRMPFPGRSLTDTRKILSLENLPQDDLAIRHTPMLLEHSVDDPLVLIGNGRILRDTLRGFGASVEWREYPDGGHWFHSPDGMSDVVDFLHKILDLEQRPPAVQEAPSLGTDPMELS
ncbi:hypothetical protein PgNI_10467 [Pyricularia grisea]|uniref:Phospholipase/carboxylesterase/thioesterase domain-containing protein n=1 Tax=Pyricularia grisea TaxID=148305 RepID=A0A6P8AZ89_PYRGI|nr:hypothetical protein PgNI_10467 [Pyricularia grisea]TLD07703.1 hypothetical protein PgNI_10467 [Pyricularia grisea]